VLSLLLVGIGVLHSLIGGVKLVYSLPGYAIIGFAGVLAAIVPRDRSPARGNRLCLFATFALAAYVVWRALTSPVEYYARNDLFMVLAAVVVYLVAALHLTSIRLRMAVIWTLFAFALVDLAIGAIQFKERANFMLMPWMFRPNYGYRASGFYVCPNHMAGFFEILALVALSVSLWARGRTWVRMVAAYVAVSCLAGLAITGSRGGYLSIVAGLLCFSGFSLFVVWKLRRRWFWPLVLLAVFGGIGAIFGSVALMRKSPDLDRRLGEIWEPKNMRVHMWKAALKAHELSPVTGVGSGSYLYYGRHFRDQSVQLDPQHVHCDYLELLCEYGIIGTVLFASFLVFHVRAGFRGIKHVIRSKLRPLGEYRSSEIAMLIGIFGALGAIAFHSIIDFNLHIPANAMLVAFLLGILASSGQDTAPAESKKRAFPWRRVLAPVAGAALILLAVPDIQGEYNTELARIRHRDRMYTEAIDYSLKALKHDDANPNLYFYYGEAKHSLAMLAKDPTEQSRLHNEAAVAFNEGLKRFPQDLNLLLKLGRTLDNLNRFPEAERVFRVALGADPNLGSVYAYYGFHCYRLHQLKRAEKLYNRAVELGEVEIARLGLNDIVEYRRLALDEDVGDQYPIEDEDGDDEWVPERL
jgi:O-antigen ligase